MKSAWLSFASSLTALPIEPVGDQQVAAEDDLLIREIYGRVVANACEQAYSRLSRTSYRKAGRHSLPMQQQLIS
jgi:hypothetical protein